jgi:glycosyltransferase involved in cell wall biosynthesis
MTTGAGSLRILLATPWLFPESSGGTEIYVHGLARHLANASVEVAVAAPWLEPQVTESMCDGIRVFRFSANDPAPEHDINRPAPHGWLEILQRFAPNVVDIHALTSSLELPHLKAAKERGARTVTTLHIPNLLCARGTFMRFGAEPCSGNIAREPCTACRLQANGVPRPLGRLLATIPEGFASVAIGPLPSGVKRALRAGVMDRRRRAWVCEIIKYSDRLVAPSQWLVDALLANDVPRQKIVLSRQGTDLDAIQPSTATVRSPTTLRVGFIGRYDWVKGLHVLIDAVRQMPHELPVEVHVWGIVRSAGDRRYREGMIARANGDPRIIFHEETGNVRAIYAQLDVVAVPSLWLETGPLVVLEAQAAGVPVVGSNLGGIAERVVDGQNGLLVPFGDATALAEALTSLADHPDQLHALRPQTPPRSGREVADDALHTYQMLRSDNAA